MSGDPNSDPNEGVEPFDAAQFYGERDATELGHAADLLGDLFDQAAAVFAAHGCLGAGVRLPSGQLFAFARGEFTIDEQELSKANVRLRSEAARLVAVLFALCCARRDAAICDIKDAAEKLATFVRERGKPCPP